MPAICMCGEDAAQLFYSDHFERRDAAPGRIEKTLFGRGGIQGLDGRAHLHRKAMYLSLMNASAMTRLRELYVRELYSAALEWAERKSVTLYPEFQAVLTRVACAWAGVPLDHLDTQKRRRQLVAMFDAAGRIGLPHLFSRGARQFAESWISDVIGDIRSRLWSPGVDTPAAMIASMRDETGELLPAHVAAVELLSILRPMVAISVFNTFVAHALQLHPPLRRRLREDEEFLEPFVQEVRRFYPFFPAVVARVRESFVSSGFEFPEGTRTLLDLYGTNHDPSLWEAPNEFRPVRFIGADPNPYRFIPQGGGDPHFTHRCPGENPTVEIMRETTRFLLRSIRYEVPRQDLRIDFGRLPAMVRSRFLIREVRVVS
jgi:fatty-acid peroxygenase